MQRRPNSPRRPMTRRQYEALQRQRRQNMIGIGIIAGIAVVLVVAMILILKPKPRKDVTVVAAANTPEPVLAATVAPLDIAADDASEGADSPAETATPLPTEVPELPAAIEEVVSTPRPDGALRSVRFRVVGDIMICKGQLAYAKNGSTYDFHNQFELISDVLQNADYTMGNMEGTVGKYGKSAYSGYPQFNCPETVLEALKDCGIDFLTLANNHMLDRWVDGLKNTVTWVEQYGFDHVGAYRTQAERDTPVIYEIGGIKFGFVAYTHTTNTMEKRGADPEGVAIGVPYIAKADFKADIQKLRSAGAEVVIAFPHWGKEYVRTPDSSQKKYAKALAEAGADIIIGSHSHMVQPAGYQTITDADGRVRKVFTMFSMGNFISDHTLQYTDNGVILDFTVNENADGTFTCDSVGYIPTYTWQMNGGFRVIPSGRYINDRPSIMTDETYARMTASYYEIIEIMSVSGEDFQLING